MVSRSKDKYIWRIELHSARAAAAREQRRLLAAIVEIEASDTWRDDGARDFAQWLSAEIGISNWAARRWIRAAAALPHLPLINKAFLDTELSFDKVLELCRFATVETEGKLIRWARRVTVAAIRRRGNAHDVALQDVLEAHRSRHLQYWWSDEGTRLWLEGGLPADQGAVVVAALDRMAGRLPDIIDPDRDASNDETTIDERRADALYALCSARIASDPDADRATVVVHAQLKALVADGTDAGCEVERGPVLHPETVRRLTCDSRLQVVLHGEAGVVGVGRMSRTAPAWIHRVMRHRDGGCTFPGCEMKHFLHAHHIQHWTKGGRTDIDNLVLVCGFHHKLVHEYGWNVALKGDRTTWTRPSGKTFEPKVVAPSGNRAPPVPRLFEVA